MNANMSHMMKRTIFVLAFGICLTFAALPDARAHTIEFRPGFVEVHYGYTRATFFPSWLRRNREFQHWYWHSHYRFRRHMNWRRLYHSYLDDRRHHRHTVGNHRYYDHGYSRPYKKGKKRN